MRIKKVSQTTTTSSQVTNSYTESNRDTYSCNYINNKARTVVNKYISSDFTTNSQTPVTTPLSAETETFGGDIYVDISVPVSTSAQTSNLYLFVDGVDKGNIGATNLTSCNFVQASKILNDIDAGTHIFEIRMISQSSNTTAKIHSWNTMNMSIIEL